jgi:hypothetical protein
MEKEEYYSYHPHHGWMYYNPHSKEVKAIFERYHRLTGPQYTDEDPDRLGSVSEVMHYFTVHGVSLCRVLVLQIDGKWKCYPPDIDPNLLDFQH